MAHVGATFTWKLELTNEEFMIVNRALRGLDMNEWKAQAAELCARMTEMRAGVIRNHIRTAEQLETALDRKSR